MRRWLSGLLMTLGALGCLSGPLHAQGVPKGAAKEASVLIKEPKTPEALFDAVVLMLDLERPNLASQYLNQLMAVELDDATILKMRDKHGPATFLRLANDARFEPQGPELLEKMNAAFKRFAGDPARMDKLIAQLTGDPEKRESAIIQLRTTGGIALPRMLAVLDQAEPKQRDAIAYALTRMGKAIGPALIGALESPSEKIRAAAIEALGFAGSNDTVAYLWHPAFSDKSPAGTQLTARRSLARILKDDPKKAGELTVFGAAAQMEKVATTHFRNEHEWILNDDQQVDFWYWDRDINQLAARSLLPKTASLISGSRIARQALDLAPDRDRVRALFLGLRLALDAHLAGPGSALPQGPGTAHDVALEAGPEMALSVLDFSLKNPNPDASLAAIAILSQVGSKRLIDNRNGQASPLVAALNYPNFAVQFAAASAIMQFDPDQPFRSSQRVVEILKRALNDSGSRHALTIDPNKERGSTSAAWLGQVGYEPSSATTGQEGFKVAADRGDVSLVVIHAACIQWGLTQTIANFRADARTAGIPIVIYGPEGFDARLGRLLTDYPLVDFTTEGEASFKRGVETFLARLDSPPPAAEHRDERIRAAGFWFAHIANGRRANVFDISSAEAALFEATNFNTVGVNGVIGLGAIATPSSQERLQEIATAEARAPEIREAAALALAAHVQNHGVLIGKDKVLAVKQALDKATNRNVRQALASVVGALRPEPSRVLELLQSLPDAALPATKAE